MSLAISQDSVGFPIWKTSPIFAGWKSPFSAKSLSSRHSQPVLSHLFSSLLSKWLKFCLTPKRYEEEEVFSHSDSLPVCLFIPPRYTTAKQSTQHHTTHGQKQLLSSGHLQTRKTCYGRGDIERKRLRRRSYLR